MKQRDGRLGTSPARPSLMRKAVSRHSVYCTQPNRCLWLKNPAVATKATLQSYILLVFPVFISMCLRPMRRWRRTRRWRRRRMCLPLMLPLIEVLVVLLFAFWANAELSNTTHPQAMVAMNARARITLFVILVDSLKN